MSSTIPETRQGFSFNNPDISSDYLAPKFGMIVTADELRYDELFGNPLIAESDSQSITDDQLNDYTRLAVRYLEVELNIDILPRRIRYDDPVDENGNEVARTEINDSDFTSKMNRKQLSELYIREPGYAYRVVPARYEAFTKLRRRPVRDILTAKLVDPYYAGTIVDLMPYRFVKKGFSGTCYFRPRQTTYGTSNYQYIWQNYLFSPYNNTRQNIFLIDYESGYENCQDIPDEFRYIIKRLSALILMNIYGDGKLAAIASRSVSLNQVSESVNTTLSATSATFGARIIQYQKDIKAWFAQNRSKYSRTLFGKLGGN